ncbi:MAG: ead/Ea22-like family protein [Desulfovibrio sp.]|uniref:hypothetical protein n=1 Tax=Desulfovibrio sp. TaxID=885 RepID=UPI00258D0E21|nr:hypothetical protein [Desulfovibrio sp.]MCD7983389.1 ead/Ea22-like family protein [Desulfovibrio sp.]
MDAEQWLADLEAKAKAATPGPWLFENQGCTGPILGYGDDVVYCACRILKPRDAEYIAAANPATVLRLVGMVRWLADNLQRRTCPDQTPSCEVGCQQCVIAAAYTATEERHDQD